MACGGQSMDESVFGSSQASLVAIHRPRSGGMPERLARDPNQEPRLVCTRQRTPPPTTLPRARNKNIMHKLVKHFGRYHALRSSFFFQVSSTFEDHRHCRQIVEN